MSVKKTTIKNMTIATFKTKELYEKNKHFLPPNSIAFIEESAAIKRAYLEEDILHLELTDGRNIAVGNVRGPAGPPGVIISETQPEHGEVWLDPSPNGQVMHLEDVLTAFKKNEALVQELNKKIDSLKYPLQAEIWDFSNQ